MVVAVNHAHDPLFAVAKGDGHQPAWFRCLIWRKLRALDSDQVRVFAWAISFFCRNQDVFGLATVHAANFLLQGWKQGPVTYYKGQRVIAVAAVKDGTIIEGADIMNSDPLASGCWFVPVCRCHYCIPRCLAKSTRKSKTCSRVRIKPGICSNIISSIFSSTSPSSLPISFMTASSIGKTS